MTPTIPSGTSSLRDSRGRAATARPSSTRIAPMAFRCRTRFRTKSGFPSVRSCTNVTISGATAAPSSRRRNSSTSAVENGEGAISALTELEDESPRSACRSGCFPTSMSALRYVAITSRRISPMRRAR